MTEAQQAKYVKLGDEARMRYKAQMLEYEEKGYFTRTDGMLSHQVIPENPKFHDHVVLPKKPQSSFLFFLADANPKNKEKFPDIPHK